MKNKNTLKLILILAFFIALWIVSVIVHTTTIWFIIINLLALYMILKYRNFEKKDIIIGCILGIICIPSNFLWGLWVVLPYVGAMCVFKNSKNKIFLYDNGKNKNFVVTILLIFIVGGILGAINIFLGMSGMSINPSLKLKWIFDALRAGIFEEIFFRMFFFAICVHFINSETLSKLQNFLCYAIMVIPHVLIHFNSFETFNIGSLIILTLLFGTPFALMQRKWNLISAIGSHAFVDMIRFCTFGI